MKREQASEARAVIARGEGGPPERLPKGSGVALVVISVVTLGTVLGLLAWLML